MWFRECSWINRKKKYIFSDVPKHLHSNTCFGDNIEDEWFIVHLLLEISKQFKDVIIQVMDNDGDFLLIEAADFLESWVNPGNTTNRVSVLSNILLSKSRVSFSRFNY